MKKLFPYCHYLVLAAVSWLGLYYHIPHWTELLFHAFLLAFIIWALYYILLITLYDSADHAIIKLSKTESRLGLTIRPFVLKGLLIGYMVEDANKELVCILPPGIKFPAVEEIKELE